MKESYDIAKDGKQMDENIELMMNDIMKEEDVSMSSTSNCNWEDDIKDNFRKEGRFNTVKNNEIQDRRILLESQADSYAKSLRLNLNAKPFQYTKRTKGKLNTTGTINENILAPQHKPNEVIDIEQITKPYSTIKYDYGIPAFSINKSMNNVFDPRRNSNQHLSQATTTVYSDFNRSSFRSGEFDTNSSTKFDR